nr:polysaccharide biosynthesis C-terminal domain-containing protein [Natronococcus occultus]
MSRRSSGSLSTGSARIATLFLGFVTLPIIFRLLGPAEFGDYSVLLSAFAFYAILVSSGIVDGVRNSLEAERSIADWEPYVVGYYLRLALLFALTGAFVLVFLSRNGYVATLFGDTYTSYVYGLAILGVSVQFQLYSRETLAGLGLQGHAESLGVLEKVAFAVVAIPLLALGFGVPGALVGHAVASIICGAIGLVAIHQHVSLSSVLRIPPREFPRTELLAVNSVSVVLLFLFALLYHVDILLLHQFRESAAVGNYRAALFVAELLWFVPIALQAVPTRSTPALWARDRVEELAPLAPKTTRYTALLTAVVAVILGALADTLVPIYFGSDATPAIGPLLVLLPGALGFALARPVFAASKAEDAVRYPIAATAGAAGITVVLNILLIPPYGMYGAAVATTIGYGSMFVFHVLAARRIGFDPLAGARLGRVAATTALAAVPIFALATVVVNPWLALLLVPLFGLFIALVFAVLTGTIAPSEPFELLAALPEPIGPRAEPIRRRLEDVNGDLTAVGWFQSMLFLAGITLLLSGILLATFGPDTGVPVFG